MVITLTEYAGLSPDVLAILKSKGVEITQPPKPPETGENPELKRQFAELQKERELIQKDRLNFADERFAEKLNGIVAQGIVTKPIADMCLQVHHDYIRKTDGNLVTFTGETETTETIGDYMIKTLASAKPMVSTVPIKFQKLDIKSNGDGKDGETPKDPIEFNEQGETVDEEAARLGAHPRAIKQYRERKLELAKGAN